MREARTSTCQLLTGYQAQPVPPMQAWVTQAARSLVWEAEWPCEEAMPCPRLLLDSGSVDLSSSPGSGPSIENAFHISKP